MFSSMKPFAMLLLALIIPLATGQLLNNGIGALPGCGDSCAILTSAQSACGSSWTCFCKNVWAASGEDPTTMCNTACTNPADQANIAAWFNANCGSDNGASEHPATTATGSAPTTSASTGASSSGSDTNDGSSNGGGCSGSWWHCHYGIIIGVIIIAIFLVLAGFGARWWKKRHDRKRDQNRTAFNSGITTTSSYDEKAAGAAAPFEAGSEGSKSSARTREAFMPFGYGYTRSESRNDEPVVTRGGTPFEEMEKGEAPYPSMPESGVKNKVKRVMVRERSVR